LQGRFNRYASTKSQIVDIHIKVDTGMGRIGVAHEKAYSFVKDVATLKISGLKGYSPIWHALIVTGS